MRAWRIISAVWIVAGLAVVVWIVSANGVSLVLGHATRARLTAIGVAILAAALVAALSALAHRVRRRR